MGDPALWVIALAAFAVYTAPSLAHYLTGQPASYDLGIFTEAVARYAHFQPPDVPIKGMDLLGDHFSPALAALVPAWWVYPSAATLLVMQAALAAVSVVPAYRAALHLLSRRGEALIIAAAYGFSWGLSQMVWVDFHEVALAVPLLAFSLSALVRGRARAAVWWALPLVFVKEDFGWTLVAIGLVLAVTYRKRLLGSLVAAWGAGWSLLAVYVLIPAMNPQHQYPYWRIGPHHIGMLVTGWETKSAMMVFLLLPTAALALRSPLAVVALPALALRLASSDPSYWGTTWHYSATAMPIVFVAAVDGLARLRRSGRPSWAPGVGPWVAAHGPAMMLAVAVVLVWESPLYQLWNPATYRTPRHIEVAEQAERMIPSGQTVAATMGELASLGSRDSVCWGQCPRPPQWLLLDQAKGEWWQSTGGPSTMTGDYPHASYRLVFRADGVWLLRRVG